MTLYFKPKPTGGCVITMADRTDQETGAPPPDPNTPASSSEIPEGADVGDQGQAQPKSPDEDPDSNREGGTPTHEKESTGGEEDEDED